MYFITSYTMLYIMYFITTYIMSYTIYFIIVIQGNNQYSASFWDSNDSI